MPLPHDADALLKTLGTGQLFGLPELMAAVVANDQEAFDNGSAGSNSWYPLSEYPGIVMGTAASTQAQREANLAAMQAWAAECIADNLVMFLDGEVRIHGANGFDLRDKSFRLEGLHFGNADTVKGGHIIQTLDNAPVFQCGETTAGTFYTQPRIANVKFSYLTQQTGTSAIGFRLGQTYMYSTFRNIAMTLCYTGMRHVTGNLFSCLFDSLLVSDFRGYGWESQGGGTGNIINGLHIVGNTASPPTVKAGIWQKFCHTGSWNQINLEWFQPDTAGMLLETCRTNVFNSVNLEGLRPFNNHALVEILFGCYGIVMNAVKVQTPQFLAANGTTTGSIFKSNGQNSVTVNGLHIQESTKTGSTLSLISGGPTADGTANDDYYIDNFVISFDTPELDDIDDTYAYRAANPTFAGVVKRFNNLMDLGGGAVTNNDADVTAVGFRSNPTNWYITVPLTAARTLTFKNHIGSVAFPFYRLPEGCRARVIRSVAATGAFPLRIANHAGTILCELWPGEECEITITRATPHDWVLVRTARLVPGTVRTIAGLAAAGDEQLEGVPLTPGFNIIATATATTADGALLPTAVKDLRVEVRNKHATVAIDVWPHTGDTINGGTADTGVLNIPAGDLGIFVAEDSTNWHGLVVAGTHV